MEKEECSICFFQYDKVIKVPRVLRCGHTFCQTCLDEIKGGPLKKHATTITCPNCRLPTENVLCTKNLPENDGVFYSASHLGRPLGGTGAGLGGANLLNSPYEAAKRLARESAALMATDGRFLSYLDGMEQLVGEAEQLVLASYQSEFDKVAHIAEILIRMIEEYKDKV